MKTALLVLVMWACGATMAAVVWKDQPVKLMIGKCPNAKNGGAEFIPLWG